jgi:hypothetical protein
MIKSKRGRKPKNKMIDSSGNLLDLSNQVITNKIIPNPLTDISNAVVGPKKRGRKPKGGKIVENLSNTPKISNTIPNIILHLNCTLFEVNQFFNCSEIYSPEILDIKTYNEIDSKIFTSNYELVNSTDIESNDIMCNTCDTLNTNMAFFSNITNNDVQHSCRVDNLSNIIPKDNIMENKKSMMKLTNKKLMELSYKLHNNISDGKSACFWCTYNFDTPNIYIPKTMDEDNIHVYGCFCTPECATSYLINENIDTSIKYERHYLLNSVYSKIYNYTKLIKPAPNPYYTLDKFCGNMSIEEYRYLLNEDNLIIIVNKPLTRIYPELFEDNNNKSNISNIINNNKYNINMYK